MLKYFLDKYFEKTKGFYPFFKYCPKKYQTYYINKRASRTLGYDYDWTRPETFNEKIRWLINNERLNSKTILTDKIKMKAYVASKIGDGHTSGIFGIFDSFNDIDFNSIPNEFALKANHAWKMNLFVKNKNYIYENRENLCKLTKAWLNTNYEQFSLEPQYKGIQHKLFIEYLRPLNKFRREYQVHCFNSEPVMVEVPVSVPWAVFYDVQWKKLPFTINDTYLDEYNFEKPEKLEEMLEYSRLLSNGFSYVRIDFSIYQDRLQVGELTFTPFSAMIPFSDKKYDLELGDMLCLPKKSA